MNSGFSFSFSQGEGIIRKKIHPVVIIEVFQAFGRGEGVAISVIVVEKSKVGIRPTAGKDIGSTEVKRAGHILGVEFKLVSSVIRGREGIALVNLSKGVGGFA